jgi:hypothetical protein
MYDIIVQVTSRCAISEVLSLLSAFGPPSTRFDRTKAQTSDSRLPLSNRVAFRSDRR